jgi:hypothetical protein
VKLITAFILLLAGRLHAEAQPGPDIAELLRISAEEARANEPKTKQYLYREYVVSNELNNKGEPTSRHTETWEVIGLEGSDYRNLIQRDDMPLSSKEQKKEDERLRKETEKRVKKHGLKIPNPIQRSYSFGYGVGDERFFDFRYVGDEAIGGRPAYMLEGTPKPVLKPANDHEKQLFVSRVKLWIDQEETYESGFEIEVTGDGSNMRPGTRIGFTQMRMDDGTWLIQEFRWRMLVKPLRVINVGFEKVATRSDYHKFVVDSKILEPQ